jgi:hypothetical protein
MDEMDVMDDLDFFAGGGTAGDRKSPTQSATSVQEGTLAIGNDGRFYATVLNKNSVGSWRNVDNFNFNDNFRILSWTQNISGRDKSYEGVSTITFYWENNFYIDVRLTIRQISRMNLQVVMYFQQADRIISISELPSIGAQFLSNQIQNTLISKIREQKSYANYAVSDLETMAVVAGENLKHDFERIWESLNYTTDTGIPTIFNYRTADLNSKFNRNDLLPQPASFDPFEENEPPPNDADKQPSPEVLEISEKSVKEVQKEVKAIIENVETPKKSRKELKQDYADLSFLISITQPIDVITMSELKQQARALKDEIDRLGLIEKDVLLAENHIFDELFTASSIQPKHRYNLTPAIDGFAPDGTPTQLPKKIYEMVSTDQFEDWFGNFQLAYQFQNTSYSDVPCSVVKNEHFEPQIVYHGTGSEFSFFDFNKFPAMYFAENFSYAEWFANEKGRMEGGHDGYVYPFLLNIKNPLDLTHFGINKISPQEFADWMYLQCGLTPDELKMNKALLDPNVKNWAWVYLRNGSEMLKVLRDTKLFDGIVYFEQNPPIPPTAPNYMTKGFIIFDANNAKIVDPERHNVLLASMRSFYLKKGGKL